MEEILEIPYDEPASSTEAASEAVDSSIGEEEIIRQQAELGNAICVAETLEAIGVEIDKAPDGVSAPMGRALSLAVEHLCNVDFGDDTKLSLPAFEEFSTYGAQRNASMESMAKIKDFSKRVWEWIKKLIRDIIKSIKKLFGIQNAKQKVQEVEIDSAIEEARTAKEKERTSPHKETTVAIGFTPDGFKDKVTMRRLSTNGRFVGGGETINSFKHHHELLVKLENGFLRIDKDVVDNLEAAMRNIYVSGKEYSRVINLAMVAVTAPLSGHHIPNRRELPDGVKTFETPLVFGGMSIYREAVVADVELSNDSLRSSFDVSSNAHDTKLPESAPFLQIDDIDAGLKLARARCVASRSYINKLEDAADALSRLEYRVGKIAIESVGNEMAQRRARRILQVVHAYLETRRVFANSMVSYSHAVNAAMVNYCVKSNRHDGKTE